MKTLVAFATALSLTFGVAFADVESKLPQSKLDVQVALLDRCLDPDGNGQIDALTDGIILLRAMFLLTGTAVVSPDVVGDSATRTTWPEIRDFLNANCGTAFQ